MKDSDLLKIGFWGLLIYGLARQNNQLGNNVNYDNVGQIPQSSPYSLTAEEINSIVDKVRANWTFTQPSLTPSLIETKPAPDPQTIETGKWLRLIPHPSIVLIAGRRGSGKSALGYRLLEHLRWVASPYVVGLPKDARKYLPDWIGMVAGLENVPPKSIVLVDEGYLVFHARRSMAATSIEMSQLVNLSRQREQTLIFVSQEARQIDKNIASSANVVMFKDLGMLQLEFDRRELNKIAAKAQQAFASLNGDKRKWAYVYAPDSNFMGLMENSLPTFWSEKLSHIFATPGEVITRAPKKTSLDQRKEEARRLRQQGLSLKQIGDMLGVTKPTIKNYLEGYPYKA